MKQWVVRWVARVTLVLIAGGLIYVILLPKSTARVWPVPGAHPPLVLAMLMLMAWIVTGVVVIGMLALVVHWLWEKATP